MGILQSILKRYNPSSGLSLLKIAIKELEQTHGQHLEVCLNNKTPITRESYLSTNICGTKIAHERERDGKAYAVQEEQKCKTSGIHPILSATSSHKFPPSSYWKGIESKYQNTTECYEIAFKFMFMWCGAFILLSPLASLWKKVSGPN